MYPCSVSQSCPTLYNPMDCSPPGSSVHEIFQARILQWVPISSSRGSSQPRGWILSSCVSCIVFVFIFLYCIRYYIQINCVAFMCICALLCPTLCDSPGSSVHGILWARILEWVAISYSWGSSKADSLPLSHLENPNFIVLIHFKDCWACMYTVILLYVYFGNYWSIHKFKFKVFSHFNSFLTYYERYMWLAREAM